MTSPLHASYYADQASQQDVAIAENVELARDTYRLRFECPTMARRAVPGQFLMLRLAGVNDPLIGRALALYDTVWIAGAPWGIDVVYLAKGKFTRRLAECRPGTRLTVWGPLGNGFPAAPAPEHLIMVAGGIGQTPFLALATESVGARPYGDPPRSVTRATNVTLCYGARSSEYLAGVEDFERLGVEVRISTDDGSRGHRGLVTDVLDQVLTTATGPRRIVTCGPEVMLQAVAKLAQRHQTPCQVSLETPMACGIGICFSCVAKIQDARGDWDYKRTCVEGPVFDAASIAW